MKPWVTAHFICIKAGFFVYLSYSYIQYIFPAWKITLKLIRFLAFMPYFQTFFSSNSWSTVSEAFPI